MESTTGSLNDQIQLRLQTCQQLRQHLEEQLTKLSQVKSDIEKIPPEAQAYFEIIASLWEEIVKMGLFATTLGEESARLAGHVQQLTIAHNALCEVSTQAKVKYLSPLDFIGN